MVENKNRLAIVTGGTSGIGKEISLFLAKKDYRLALVYRNNSSRAQETLSLIQSQVPNCEVKIFTCDVALNEDVRKCYSEIKSTFGGPPQVLINSAGVTTNNLVVMEKSEVYENLINTNYLGAVYFCKAVIQDMMRQRFGRIINMSSISANCFFEGHAAYAASKAALEKFSFILGAEIAKYHVTVNVIRPGLVLTPMTEIWLPKALEKVSEDRVLGPMRELIKPEEICNVIELLLQSNQITCAGIDIDGGLSKYGKT